MPDASVAIGIDAREMYRDLQDAVTRFNNGMGQMGVSADRMAGRVGGAETNLLRSSHRVAAQIHTVSQSLLSGASAGDVFGASLEGIGRSLNLSLGALAGLAIGGVAVQKIYALHEAVKKANEEVDKLLHEGAGSGDFKSFSNLESHIKEVSDRLATLRKEAKGGMWQNIKDAFGENLFTDDGEILPDSGKSGRRRAGQIGALESDESKAGYAASDKLRRLNDLKRASLAGAPDYETKAKELQSAHDEANTPVHLLTESAIKLKLAFDELAQSVTGKHMERSGMTVAEMAAHSSASGGYNADGTAWTIPYEQWKAIQDAKASQGATAQGEAQRLNFDPEGAHASFNQAGAINAGISGLKPSEQMEAGFKGALVVTEGYLRTIAENSKLTRQQ